MNSKEWLNHYRKKLQESHQTFRPNGFDILGNDLEILELIKRDPGELAFVVDAVDYDDYVRTYTEIGGSPEDAVYTKEEFTTLRSYFVKE